MAFSNQTIDDIFLAHTQLSVHSDMDRDAFIWLVDADNDGLLMIEKSDFRNSMNNIKFSKHDREDFQIPTEEIHLAKAIYPKTMWFFKKNNFNEKLDEFKQAYQIPIQYEQFLIKYNGGILDNNKRSGFYIPALDSYIYLSVLFGLNTHNDMNDLMIINKKFASYLPANMIIIGEDLTNGFIVMDLKDNNAIYYWDINSYYDYTSLNSNAYLISDSIAELFQTIVSN